MDWLISLGYIGLFLGALIAGTVVPMSTDVLMIAMLLGGADPWMCLIVATAGNWLGVMLSYGLGWLGKWKWLEKYFGVKQEKLEKQKAVIDKYGVWVALFSWLPVVGNLAVIALGFYRVKPKMTALLLLIGCFARFLVWTLLYINFGEQFIEWVSR